MSTTKDNKNVLDRIRSILGATGVGNLDRLANVNKLDKISNRLSKFTPDGLNVSPSTLAKFEAEPLDARLEYDEYYTTLNRLSALQSMQTSKAKPFYYNVNRGTQREKLRRLAQQDEMRSVLIKVANEAIVTKKDATFFADIKVNELQLAEYDFTDSEIKQITEQVTKSYGSIYRQLSFLNDGAWKMMVKFLIDGEICFENVYDDADNPKILVGFVEVDPHTMEEVYVDGKKYWIHTKTKQHQHRAATGPNSAKYTKIVMHDWQVTKISWRDIEDSGFDSYVNQLMKSYNMLRIIEETKIIFAVTNATFRTLYKVPTKGKSRNRAAQSVAQEMNRYMDEIEFDSSSGEIMINDSANIPFSKTHFMGEGDSGTPSIETLGGDGPDLQSLELNSYFANKFYRATMMPPSRFDQNGETWNLDPTSTLRGEIDYARFIDRIRTVFSLLILKPVLIDLGIKLPFVKREIKIAECVYLEYVSYNIFTELMEQDIEQKKLDHMNAWLAITITNSDGDSVPYIPLPYLLKKIFAYSDDDLKEFEDARIKEIETRFKEQKRILELKKKYGLEDLSMSTGGEQGDFPEMADDEQEF